MVLATMKAEDKDFGANGSVFYRFAAPVQGFSINSLTGEIQATKPLRDLTQAQRTLIVEAMDQGSPAQSAQGVVVIYVKEVEYNGIRFSRNARDVSIQENAAKGWAIFKNQKLDMCYVAFVRFSPVSLLSQLRGKNSLHFQVQLWLRLRPNIQMAHVKELVIDSLVETKSRLSVLVHQQVNPKVSFF